MVLKNASQESSILNFMIKIMKLKGSIPLPAASINLSTAETPS